jgi:glucose/arabinose dehydrogenase
VTRRFAIPLLVSIAAALAAASPASAKPPPVGSGDGGFTLTEVGRFVSPIHADNAPGAKGALYVVEPEGVIRVLQGTAVRPRPFLDISDLVQCCGEEGLFSVAFHPAYRQNRLFYVYFTNNLGDQVVMEFKRKKKEKRRFEAIRSSGRQVLYVPHPNNGNHNGGTIAFGPDKLLYIAPGDGGSGGDPPNNAQNPESLLGKLLRIDPRRSCTQKFALRKKRKTSTATPTCRRYNLPYGIPRTNPFFGAEAGLDEIYAIGLRNPFRFTFDALTGAIAIGDVGQDCREEINFRTRGTAHGVNFGWSGYEGTRVHNAGRVAANVVFPILEYDNSSAGGGCSPLGSSFDGVSVIAGFVVRDERLRGQYGRLLYSDASNPQIRSLIPSQVSASDDQSTGLSVPFSVFSFAEGFRNQLYVISDGPVYRMDPA